MIDEILNTLGLFEFGENSFDGIISKNNGNLEFTVLNTIFKSDDDYLLINGYVNGKKVSFVMFNYPIVISTNQTRKETYSIHSLFIGKHFQDFNQLNFKNSIIKINNISSAINLSAFHPVFTGKMDKEYKPLVIKPQEDYVVNLNDFTLKVRLNSFYETRGRLGNGEYANFKEEIVIICEYGEKQAIDRITGDALIIQHLFTFITGRSRIIELIGFNDEYKDEVNMFVPIVSDETVDGRGYPSAIQLDETNIEDIVKKWFDNFKQLDSVYDLYFSLENSHLNPATLFLTFAQMIESYHRQRYCGEYIDEAKFKKISKKVRKFLKKVDEIENIEKEDDRIELINKMVSSIKFSYQFTLHDRLIEIFNDLNQYEFFEKILKKFTKGDGKIEEFCILIKNNRNYYTHYGVKKENVLDDKDLMELNEALKLVIDLIFLKEFEFPVEEVNRITYKNRDFRLNTYVDCM